ncbi:MAG: vWA domain-containing protein, partial [Candidatus Micrarchaeota archaeon]
MAENRGKRGIAFTLDAVMALLIVIALVPVFLLLTARSPTQTASTEHLHLLAEDAVDSLSKMQIRQVRSDPVVADFFNRTPPALTDEDLDSSVLDILGGLWASQDPTSLADAANLTKSLLGGLIPSGLKWQFSIVDISGQVDVIYNTTELSNSSDLITASRKAASGFARNQSSTGYVAKAFLENIIGKEDNSYFFFGGFVGEGNLTATISDIPVNSTISKIYLEVNGESNFSMYLNGQHCRDMVVSGGNFTVDNWTIMSNETCISYFSAGEMNNFTFIFSHQNITKHYFGGGYLRVTFTTDELIPASKGYLRYYFPGIDGLVNLYDSFYVPGNITSMNAKISVYSYHNYSTLMWIGNTTIVNHTGSNLTEEILINNANFTALFAANNITYFDLSETTNPLRMLIGANITGGKINGTVDVVLITDVSGSMAWRMDSDSTTGVTDVSNCDDPNLYLPTNRRINVARCLDKLFVNAILGGNASACGEGTPLVGNRVALVNFSTSLTHNTSLQNGGTANLTYLINMINGYVSTSSTCLACAINRAYEILLTQSSPERQKYIIVMTDGQANYHATGVNDNLNGIASSNDGGYSSILVQDTGYVGRRTNQFWEYGGDISGNNLNAISMLNSTFGFTVSSNGEIYFWDGASWSLMNATGLGAIYAVDVLNGTFALAGGTSGRIHRFDGTNWGLMQDTGSQNWSAITISNGSWAMAGTAGGVIYRYAGSTWASYSTLSGGDDIFSMDSYNSTYAIAGTDSENVHRWTGSATWTEIADLGSSDIRGISFVNSSLAYGASSSGEISQWTFTTGSNVYTQPGGRQLNGIVILNSTEGYAVGDYGRVLVWDGNAWNLTAKLSRGFEGNLTTGLDGNDDDLNCGTFMSQSYASMNANYSTARITWNLVNYTVDSVGFGPIGTCMQANETLDAVATTGNGTFYASSNSSELQSIYCQIARNINTKATATQEVTFSGNLTRATLYPDSYIEIYYWPATPDPSYKEISVTTETDTFPNCSGTFLIAYANDSRIIDSKLTSYSSNYWTNAGFVNSSATNGYSLIFNLTNYNLPYGMLGDPFHLYLPINLLKAHETNNVIDQLGLNE